MGSGPEIGAPDAPYRTVEERLAVAAARLRADRDCWLVTASVERGPCAVPLSFLAFGARLLLATARDRAAVGNVEADPRVTLILGGFGDAIRLVGEAEVVPFDSLDSSVLAGYVAKAGWNPVRAGFAALVVTLSAIHCSRSPAEDRDRVVWRAGAPTVW